MCKREEGFLSMVKNFFEQISIEMKNAKKCNRPVIIPGGVHVL